MASKLLTGISIAAIAAINFTAAPTVHASASQQTTIKTDTHKTTQSNNACPGKNCCAPKGNAYGKKQPKKPETK